MNSIRINPGLLRIIAYTSVVIVVSLNMACRTEIQPVTEDSIWHFDLDQPGESRNTGAAFADSIVSLNLKDREQAIFEEISQGNLPAHLRELIPIQFNTSIGNHNYVTTIFVAPDYFSIGSIEDHLLMPMTPMLAQRVLDRIGGVLPTQKIVDLIWQAATLKLEPQPIAPSDTMVNMIVFQQHNQMVHRQRNAVLETFPPSTLVAGHKKDVIVSNRVAAHPDKVVIYGWHKSDGEAIQPVYSGHINWYVDYSHGIRPVLSRCLVNGRELEISEVLRDSILFQIFSDESNPMELTRYDTSTSNYPEVEPIILD